MFENIEFAPLPSSLMAIGLIGFIITVIYSNILKTSWTFAFGLFFLILFIASFISLHYGPIPERDLILK